VTRDLVRRFGEYDLLFSGTFDNADNNFRSLVTILDGQKSLINMIIAD
jgi:hypothetical protein